MLHRLYIKNLAIISELELEFDKKFNVFTGQTGAGKSLIIGAIEFLLGLRSGVNLIGKNAKQAIVAGEFELSDSELIKQISTLTDIAIEDGELIIQRRINPSGRISTSINSVPVGTAVLKQIGELLVDIHSQHENQFLLRATNQLRLLDIYGGSEELADKFSDVHKRWQELIRRREELREYSELRNQQIELYEFQLNEIDGAELEDNELERLESQYKQMSNIEKLRELANGVVAMLEESEYAITDQLRMLYRQVQELAEIDSALGKLPEQVDVAITELDDITRTLSRYIDNLEFEPEAFSQIDERLTLINRLMKKYGDGEFEGIFAYRDELERKLGELRKQEEDFADIDERISSLETQRMEIGKKLSDVRQRSAVNLAKQVNKHLKELAMSEAEFKVDFIEVPENQPTSCGLESVEFMIRTNPGYPMMPLRKIASAGELSRVMLAIKSILATADRCSVVVFDEVDSNVGGRLGEVIGKKLTGLAKTQQVICISHLPQIAAYADRHFVVRKQSTKTDTISSVSTVEGDDRIREIAEMISGKNITSTTIKQAKEMLDSSR